MPHTTVRPLDLDAAMESYDSKFRFVLLASIRAEQLVRGARAKIDPVGKKPTRVAMEELKAGVIPWAYGPAPAVEMPDAGAPTGDEGAASS